MVAARFFRRRLAPLESASLSVDFEIYRRIFRRLLRTFARGESDERTFLRPNHANALDFAVLIEARVDVVLGDLFRVDAAYKQRGDARIFGWRQLLARSLFRAFEHLFRHRIVRPEVSILNILLSQLWRRAQFRHVRIPVARSIRTIVPRARVSQPKRAYRRFILVIIRLLPRQPHQQFVIFLLPILLVRVLALVQLFRDLIHREIPVHRARRQRAPSRASQRGVPRGDGYPVI